MATVEEYMEVFKKGTVVEVSSEEEGLRGSWYTATVLRSISKTTNKMFVEYHNLMTDDNPSKPLREFVDAVLVRPIPPRDPPSRRYSPMDDVDAFHNDGWWEGVVINVVDSEGSRRYAVFFRCSREQIEFSASDLRLHREWVRGDVWIAPQNFSLSPRKKRKIGDTEETRNGAYGTYWISGNGVTSNGEAKGAGKRSRNVSSKQVVAENGNCRETRSTSNREAKNVGKRSRNVSSKQDVVAENGNGREARRTSSRCSNRDAAMRNRESRAVKNVANGTSTKLGVKRSRKLKEPRKRASNHAGHRQSKK